VCREEKKTVRILLAGPSPKDCRGKITIIACLEEDPLGGAKKKKQENRKKVAGYRPSLIKVTEPLRWSPVKNSGGEGGGGRGKGSKTNNQEENTSWRKAYRDFKNDLPPRSCFPLRDHHCNKGGKIRQRGLHGSKGPRNKGNLDLGPGGGVSHYLPMGFGLAY